jgi:CubicO group peptidase (beta-lactamase class C family)
MDYSNFGYCVLQATLEKVTGVPYASWVAANVLAPAGVSSGMIPGRTTVIADHEVTYYDLPTNYPIQSIYDTQGLCTNGGTPAAGIFCVPVPYGGSGPYSTGDLEAALAEGGWLSTPVDLLRLEVGLDGRSGSSAILTDASIGELQTFPDAWVEGPGAPDSGQITINPPSTGGAYGFGFNVGTNESWQNVGQFAGTLTHIYRGGNSSRTDGAAGFGWVAFFNGTNGSDPTNSATGQIGAIMSKAFNAVGASGAWLSTSLFDQYGQYTQWMSGSQYQALFNSMASKGQYPTRVEGKNETGFPMFRATANHGMDCLSYSQKANTMKNQGYAQASLQSYVGSDGLRYYQSVWIKW